MAQTLRLLDGRERFELILLLPAVMLMAILEVVGLASIVPLLGLLADPSAIRENIVLSWAYDFFSFSDRNDFFFAVGSVALAVIAISSAFSAFTTWRLLRFSWMRNHTLSVRLLSVYLGHPYEYFLTRNSAEFSKNILSEVERAVGGVIVQVVQLIARSLVVLSIISAVFFIDPGMAIALTGLFGCIYGGLYLAARRYLSRLGKERSRAQGKRFRLAAEMFGGIKELKLFGLEEELLKRYSEPSEKFARATASSRVLGQLPRFALETVAVGSLLVAVVYLLHAGRSLNEVLPVVGLYAFAAFRMLPGLQVIFAGIANVRFNFAAVQTLTEELGQRPQRARMPRDEAPLQFSKAISLEHVHYSYPNRDVPAIRDLTLAIDSREWVALVGPTGSGKTTLVDIILGLLRPTRGQVSVDGTPLGDDDVIRWQKNVAYVPQQIFLIDDSVARNIAYGQGGQSQLDLQAIRTAGRIAQIDKFVSRDLPDGYDTVVGEQGINLSGGQRQRLGIARSLYRRPRLLVLDEATSALDGATEAAFFDALRGTYGDTTVVSIAHRLSTTQSFDRVVLLNRGQVAAIGAPADAVEGRGAFSVLHTSRDSRQVF